MPQAGSLLLVHVLEGQTRTGRFKRRRDDWPLHITLVPWFSVANEAALVAALRNFATTQPVFSVGVGGEELFGIDHDIMVNVIADQEPIRQLHLELLDIVEQAGGVMQESAWIRDKYRAHITRHHTDEQQVQEGDSQKIDEIHLIRLLEGDICEFVTSFEYQEEQ